MHQVEVGLPIVTAYTEESIPQQTHPSTVTAHTETSHLCPCVCRWVVPERGGGYEYVYSISEACLLHFPMIEMQIQCHYG